MDESLPPPRVVVASSGDPSQAGPGRRSVKWWFLRLEWQVPVSSGELKAEAYLAGRPIGQFCLTPHNPRAEVQFEGDAVKVEAVFRVDFAHWTGHVYGQQCTRGLTGRWDCKDFNVAFALMPDGPPPKP